MNKVVMWSELVNLQISVRLYPLTKGVSSIEENALTSSLRLFLFG